MHILLLSQFYAPEPVSKPHDLGKDLVARGHSVTVLTGFPNYPTGRIYPQYQQRPWQVEWLDGVRVVRVPLYPSHDTSSVRRSINYLSFAASASFFGPILSGPIDLMWIWHPPLTVGIPAWWIALTRRIPFVYEIQDMWPETLSATGMVDSSMVMRCLRGMAKFIYHRADALTVNSPGFKRNLIAKGVPAEKIHFIPNWADEDVYQPVPTDESTRARFNMQNKFNVVFAGNLGLAQALDTVLDAADLLRDLPDVQFMLVGDGIDKVRLRSCVNERHLTNVRFHPQQPMEDMPPIYACADALLVHLRHDPLFSITIPLKTMAYLASGRPVICALEGDGADVVRAAEAGIVCQPEDPGALAGSVRQLFAMPREQRERFGQAGRTYFLEHYTRRVLIDQYCDLFQQIAVKNKKGKFQNVLKEEI